MSTTSTSLSQVDSNYVKNISRENSEPAWMSEMRVTAFSKYNSLPFETSPLYSKYSDAKRLHPELVHIPQTHKQFEPNQDTIERIRKRRGKRDQRFKNRFIHSSFTYYGTDVRTGHSGNGLT